MIKLNEFLDFYKELIVSKSVMLEYNVQGIY